jgi:prefoldin subunit 5
MNADNATSLDVQLMYRPFRSSNGTTARIEHRDEAHDERLVSVRVGNRWLSTRKKGWGDQYVALVEAKDLNSKMQVVAAALNDLRAQVNALRGAIHALRERQDETIDLLGTLDDLREEVNTLRQARADEHNELRDEVNALRGAIHALRERQDETIDLRGTLDDLREEVNTLRQARADEHNELRDEVKALRTAGAVDKAVIEILVDCRKNDIAEVEKLRCELSATRAKIAGQPNAVELAWKVNGEEETPSENGSFQKIEAEHETTGSDGSSVDVPQIGIEKFFVHNGCFLPMTMLWQSEHACIAVDGLKVGDCILSIHNNLIQVTNKFEHAEKKQQVIDLRTRRSQLLVSVDHRVVIPGDDGEPSDEQYAWELKKGDLVFNGSLAVPLVADPKHFELRTRLFEITFEPDEPVSSFNASRYGILTRGESAHLDTDDDFWVVG